MGRRCGVRSGVGGVVTDVGSDANVMLLSASCEDVNNGQTSHGDAALCRYSVNKRHELTLPFEEPYDSF